MWVLESYSYEDKGKTNEKRWARGLIWAWLRDRGVVTGLMKALLDSLLTLNHGRHVWLNFLPKLEQMGIVLEVRMGHTHIMIVHTTYTRCSHQFNGALVLTRARATSGG